MAKIGLGLMRGSSRIKNSMCSSAALAGLLVVALVSLSTAPASAKCLGASDINGVKLPAGCLSADDEAVVRMRVFRSDLVVAALSCNARTQYNRLVSLHQDELVRGGHALRNLFNRLHKNKAAREMDRFVTYLTNRASQRRLSTPGYCKTMSQVFEQAFAQPSNDLRSFVLGRAGMPTWDVTTLALGK